MDVITYISPNKFIVLRTKDFLMGAKAIRWKNQGLTRYMCKDKVANRLDVLIDREQRGWMNTPPRSQSQVWWSDCEDELPEEPKDTSTDSTAEDSIESGHEPQK